MTQIEVHPAIAERFDDVAAVLAPKDPDAPACWCLSYHVPGGEFRAQPPAERPARLRRTTGLFESVGFERVVEMSSTSGGRPRWLMRLPLAD